MDLYWISLGAGGHCVRFNGKVFEALEAARQHRARDDLYHAALIVQVDREHYTIELAPSPDADETSRGVVANGAVHELKTGDMWNSNSLISWSLATTGLATDQLQPPPHGRAPGWDSGLIVAQRKNYPPKPRTPTQQLRPQPAGALRSLRSG